jgi:hypothetical protein
LQQTVRRLTEEDMLWQRLWTLKSYRELLPGEFSFDFTPRHGHVIHISEEEKERLEKAFSKGR